MAKVDVERATAEVQLREVTRGAVDLHTEAGLTSLLESAAKEGRALRVKAGFDPTAPDLHLGHTVVLARMRRFQHFGHQVIFVIGDFTARIGDPTGRSATRPALDDEAIRRNAETFKTQVYKVLDPKRTEVRFNSEWLDGLGATGIIRLAARYTVARMLERDDFKTRFRGGIPISVHEFLYPLMQAYDSVALRADVELGGTDQLFNLLVGREIMRDYDLPPQVVITSPLLEGTDARMVDGKLVGEKMSKSLGNYVGIDEAPEEIYGKLMSISDDLMWRYYELISEQPLEDLDALRARVASGEVHPKAAKDRLAREIVARYHDGAAATAAAAAFEQVHARRELPDEIPEAPFAFDGNPAPLASVLSDLGLVASRKEARRLIKQGAVRVDGTRISDGTADLDAGEHLLQVGKRKFLRVRPG